MTTIHGLPEAPSPSYTELHMICDTGKFLLRYVAYIWWWAKLSVHLQGGGWIYSYMHRRVNDCTYTGWQVFHVEQQSFLTVVLQGYRRQVQNDCTIKMTCTSWPWMRNYRGRDLQWILTQGSWEGTNDSKLGVHPMWQTLSFRKKVLAGALTMLTFSDLKDSVVLWQPSSAWFYKCRLTLHVLHGVCPGECTMLLQIKNKGLALSHLLGYSIYKILSSKLHSHCWLDKTCWQWNLKNEDECVVLFAALRLGFSQKYCTRSPKKIKEQIPGILPVMSWAGIA